MKNRAFLLTIFLFLLSIVVQASPNTLYESYIQQYAPLAAIQQVKYGIPASITLAQGLIESGAGTSDLAEGCKNHFGIKCGSNWNGDTKYKDDDRQQECFRCYKSVGQSYEDHSLFLKNGSRYAFLFDYPVTKYKAWAYGLSRAGYATDPYYAEKLIKIIETYDLAKYAEEPEKYISEVKEYTVGDKKSGNKQKRNKEESTSTSTTGLYKYVSVNNIEAVLVNQNITVHELANILSLQQSTLIRCNDYPNKDFTIHAGDYVFLHSKRNIAAPAYTKHIVKQGESMHSISQKYGIKLASLYKMNKLEKDIEARVGMELRLR
ncbi:MAG: glucosaminidase domain-containing protein [Bacteroidales bacterium]|nr:glucosaminidase domain-containing protein [Bacteroidales bacterium]